MCTVCDKISKEEILTPFCVKRLIFKRLLERLCFCNIFSVNNELIKQIEGCLMGGSISVVMVNIYMVKLGNDLVKPGNPIFARDMLMIYTTKEHRR